MVHDLLSSSFCAAAVEGRPPSSWTNSDKNVAALDESRVINPLLCASSSNCVGQAFIYEARSGAIFCARDAPRSRGLRAAFEALRIPKSLVVRNCHIGRVEILQHIGAMPLLDSESRINHKRRGLMLVTMRRFGGIACCYKLSIRRPKQNKNIMCMVK